MGDVVPFAKPNPQKTHNEKVLARLEGVPAQWETTTFLSPNSPEVHTCVVLYCGEIATRFIALFEYQDNGQGSAAGRKCWCDKHWPWPEVLV